MGRGSTFYCRTCQKRHYLGYGSYGTWLDGAQTVSEYDGLAKATGHGDLAKNQRMRKCLEEHERHDFFTSSEDWDYEKNDNLYIDQGGYGDTPPVATKLSQWEYVDMEKE